MVQRVAMSGTGVGQKLLWQQVASYSTETPAVSELLHHCLAVILIST